MYLFNYWINWSVLHSDVGFAFTVEALACKDAIGLCVVLRLEPVTVEGGSLTVIKKCRSRTQNFSEIGPHVRDIKSLLASLRSVRFSHMRRSANKLADIITTESLKLKKEWYLVGEVPRIAAPIWRDEYIREPDWRSRIAFQELSFSKWTCFAWLDTAEMVDLRSEKGGSFFSRNVTLGDGGTVGFFWYMHLASGGRYPSRGSWVFISFYYFFFIFQVCLSFWFPICFSFISVWFGSAVLF